MILMRNFIRIYHPIVHNKFVNIKQYVISVLYSIREVNGLSAKKQRSSSKDSKQRVSHFVSSHADEDNMYRSIKLPTPVLLDTPPRLI